MSKTSRYSPTEYVGVNTVEGLVLNELKWIFRPQPIADMGIDAHIELADGGNPTGKLIGVQIKTGESHFKRTKAGLVYYGELQHLDYWLGHSLPVLLIAHLPSAGETLWVIVEKKAAKKTGKRWKIVIPLANVFGAKAKSRIEKIFEGSVAEQRSRKLALDEPLMRHISNGGKVSLDLEDWINKSLGRTPVRVYVYDESGEETLSQNWEQLYVGYSIKELAETLFPWAKVRIDEEFYEQNDEIDRTPDISDYETIGEPREDAEEDYIYPYAEAAGEVESYRLELTLNELGEAYLVVADHLQKPGN